MLPNIHHARTEDGVSIAYWTLGDGPPLIAELGSWSHVQREWDIPERRAWFERAAQKHTLIRFDHAAADCRTETWSTSRSKRSPATSRR